MKTPKRLQGVKKKAHGHSPKQEKLLAKELGGKTVKGSGCGFAKGDVRIKGRVLIEAKSTEKKSFSVTLAMLDKIEDAATSQGEMPVIEIEFIGGKTPRKVCVVPEYVLNELVGK